MDGLRAGFLYVRQGLRVEHQCLTKYFQPELAHPYEVLAGKVNLTITSPKGGTAPLDPKSIEMFGNDASCEAFLKAHESLWKNTEKLSDSVKRVDDFDGIYYVGGHGRKCNMLHLPK